MVWAIKKRLAGRLLRFAVGLICLAAFFGFFASGYSPPGILGEVLRHNQAYNINATPLLYSELENMPELEEGVRLMRIAARQKQNLTDDSTKIPLIPR